MQGTDRTSPLFETRGLKQTIQTGKINKHKESIDILKNNIWLQDENLVNFLNVFAPRDAKSTDNTYAGANGYWGLLQGNNLDKLIKEKI